MSEQILTDVRNRAALQRVIQQGRALLDVVAPDIMSEEISTPLPPDPPSKSQVAS